MEPWPFPPAKHAEHARKEAEDGVSPHYMPEIVLP